MLLDDILQEAKKKEFDTYGEAYEAGAVDYRSYVIGCHAKLKSLKGIPKRISASLQLSSNRLKTLEHAPEYVHGSLDLRWNNGLKLDGLKIKVNENLNVGECGIRKLGDLSGITIGGGFLCHQNRLTDFVGTQFPECSFIDFSNNKSLKDLNGIEELRLTKTSEFQAGRIAFSGCQRLERNLLNLFYVRGIKDVVANGIFGDLGAALAIISDFIVQKRNVVDCAAALEDAGLGRFAQST